MFSYGLPHIKPPVLANQQKRTFISSVQTLDTVLRTYQAWQNGIDDKGEFRESVLSVLFEDDDNIYLYVCVCVCSHESFLPLKLNLTVGQWLVRFLKVRFILNEFDLHLGLKSCNLVKSCVKLNKFQLLCLYSILTVVESQPTKMPVLYLMQR